MAKLSLKQKLREFFIWTNLKLYVFLKGRFGGLFPYDS